MILAVGEANDAFAVTNTAALAKSIAAQVRDYGFDGIDLDDGHIALQRENIQQKFIDLIKPLRAELGSDAAIN